MNIEELRDYCIAKKGVTESFPFDNDTLVFKVEGKIFLLVNVEKADSFNVKCDPEEAIKQREAYSAIVPGYHMNKKHWNTVLLNHGLNRQLLCKLIDDSYRLIIKGLPKKVQEGYL
ncbi:MmcQ/YjbR family DNA-binding protein [Pseudopedobacter beijingensis]|uniref:MmcQ/YjbR family DNA-binding protein n=1 Tax=Pseudopedobacter beijingensis TaxID=1207056 RepID=A0ABW4I8Q2_9SPHI